MFSCGSHYAPYSVTQTKAAKFTDLYPVAQIDLGTLLEPYILNLKLNYIFINEANMNRKHLVLGAIASLVIFQTGSVSAVEFTGNFGSSQCIEGSGNIVELDRIAPETFTGIDIQASAEVFITQSPEESILIKADDNVINFVTLEVDEGTLSIGFEDPEGNCYSAKTVEVHISQEEYEALYITGAGSFKSQSDIVLDNLSVQIDGAGNTELTGFVEQQVLNVNGAGDINHFGLASQVVDATVSGAGTIEVDVSDVLNATVSGAGSIFYTGSPTTVNAQPGFIGVIQPVVAEQSNTDI